MLPPASFLSTDATKASIQVSDKKHNFSESTELTASFAQMLRGPLPAPQGRLPAAPGTLLPPPGSLLPVAAGEPEPLGGTAEIDSWPAPPFMPLPEIEPLPAVSAPAPAGDTPLPAGNEAGLAIEALPPLPATMQALGAAPADGALPANTASADRQLAMQTRRSEVTPFMRSATPAEQQPVRPLQGAADPLRSLLPPGTEPLSAPPASEAPQANVSARLAPPPDVAINAAMSAASAAVAAAAGNPLGRRVTLDPAELADKLDGLVKLAPVAGQGGTSVATAELHHLQQSAALPARPAAVPVTTINLPVGDDGWSESLQDRVMWMTSRKLQSAEIRLNPAELGPIRVQVSVQDDATRLTFTAQHPLTREAIEQAMPRLREMLSDSGLSLAGSSVSDGNDDNVQKDRHAHGQAFGGDDAPFDEADEALTPVAPRTLLGLVDTFA